ncbi:M23 family peptidase [Meiothermus sp. QL-1]|uniref:M23 family metallopeptidase n=1 Tax=Meiothermus sp. QL-1 TaxID=2058095 RepID=UPI000E0A48F2|nr:M23 family metallopeptidase [Meiothermus sp. QL-1]RDI95067.1 M23 family peptidase [Meiothermus sp. QL-1]
MPSQPRGWVLRLPLWAAGLLLLLLGVAWFWAREARQQARLAALEGQVRRLTLELEAERSRSQAYSLEAVQLEQSLRILEEELNRLREKAGLPRVRLQPRPVPPAPRGAGEPAELGELLLHLRAQMDGLALELEATARFLRHPLPPDPEPGRVLLRQEPPHLPTGLPLPGEPQVSSPFGYRPSPFGGGLEFHNGLDLVAPEGTPVYATAAGVVSEMGWNPIFGLMVLLDHGNGLHTLYGHLSASYVRRGQEVARGQLLGAVGSTGRSTGPHLHYSVYRFGVAVDPLPYLGLRVPR